MSVSSIRKSTSSEPGRVTEPLKPFFQPVSDPTHERETDAVAEKIMRMPKGEVPVHFFNARPVIQRKCSHCEEEEKIQKKSDGAHSEMSAPSSVGRVINATGQPIDQSTRTFMESRFGHDFRDVQIHDDSLAHRSSKEINALAYTHGNHVVFAGGRYQPDSRTGRQLLAHELVHVLQQSRSVAQRKVQRAAAPTKGYSFTIGNTSYTNLSVDQAAQHLRQLATSLRLSIEGDEGRQHEQMKINEDQKIVSSILETLSGADMPPSSIWLGARQALLQASLAIGSGDLQSAVTSLTAANLSWQKAHRQLYNYLDAVISAGDRTVTALEFVKKASAFTIKAFATAYLGEVAGEVIDRAYTATQEVAQQASEVHHDLRKKVDFKGIAIDALTPKETIAAACEAARAAGALPSKRGGAWDWKSSPGKKLKGPLPVYERKPTIGFGADSKALCRGACGPDCDYCDPAFDKTVAFNRPDGTIEKWIYYGFTACDTHEGCRQHDAGFDWAASNYGEQSKFAPQHMLANLECACHYKASTCVSWISGGPPSDGKMNFANSVELVGRGSEQNLIEVKSQPKQEKNNEASAHGRCYGKSMILKKEGSHLVEGPGGYPTPADLRAPACETRASIGTTDFDFMQNVAVGRFIVNGQVQHIAAPNRPGERIHSEDQVLIDAENKFGKGKYRLDALFTERPPCEDICKPNLIRRPENFWVYYVSRNWRTIKNAYYGK